MGRSIIRQQFAPLASAEDQGQLLETERGKHKLRSVTQCDDLEELMSNAVLAGTDFAAKRGEVVILGQELHAATVAAGLEEGGRRGDSEREAESLLVESPEEETLRDARGGVTQGCYTRAKKAGGKRARCCRPASGRRR